MKKYVAPTFHDMIIYKRPEGAVAQKLFCQKFLEPVFGKPDAHGNYIKIVGRNPNIAFMSHHDTVHKMDGMQVVCIENGMMFTDGKDCLGADCTTGVYIMLKMIEAKIKGVYVVHAGEEIGCQGSSKLVKDNPSWLGKIDAAISFDRKDYSSIITHQMGKRCCSEAFSDSLNQVLGGSFQSDPTGSYTDSNEYVNIVSECTNLSVGYFNQHTKSEYQDLDFLDELVDLLIKADWNKLVFARDPSIKDYEQSFYLNKDYDYTDYKYADYEMKGELTHQEEEDMLSVIKRYPVQVAQILSSFGYNADGLLDDCCDLRDKRLRSVGDW